MKKMLSVVVVVVVLLVALSVSKDLVAKTAVEKGTQLVTGLKLSMSSFRLGLVNTLVGIKDLRLFNPRGYSDKIMLDMPEIFVDYDLPAIFKGKIHLEELRINMQEFLVVKNEKGELNLDALKVVQAQKEGSGPQQKTPGPVPEMLIDNLRLKIGKVVYKDYSHGAAQVQQFVLNLDEKFTNIKDPYSLVSLIVVKALMNTTIASLTNFDLKGLQGTVSDTLASAQKVVGEVSAKAQEALQKTQAAAAQATKQTQETVKQTTETLKETSESLKKTFKLPFGGK